MITDVTEMDQGADVGQVRKPRVALMGEFSAGKSTLLNTLLGCDPLPVQITATRIPPVWISYGAEGASCIGHDGRETPLDIADLACAPLEDTRYIRLHLKSEILALCDLFDMPGISDPNTSTETWQGLIDEIDSVIWCTHATQAWRQSEAAMWEEIAGRTNSKNLLLVTQFDKLPSERDKSRVLARIRKETGASFRGVYPVSLIQAMNAGDDEEAWISSGASAMIAHFVDLLVSPPTALDTGAAVQTGEAVSEGYAREERCAEVSSFADKQAAERDQGQDAEDPDTAPKITPRRVVLKKGASMGAKSPAVSTTPAEITDGAVS